MNIESAENANVPRPATRGDVEQVIRGLMVTVLLLDTGLVAKADLDEPGLLTSLGVTSIDSFELIVSVEERLGFEFDDQELNAELVDPLSKLVAASCQKLAVK
jgi:acyl carrier protein